MVGLAGTGGEPAKRAGLGGQPHHRWRGGVLAGPINPPRNQTAKKYNSTECVTYCCVRQTVRRVSEPYIGISDWDVGSCQYYHEPTSQIPTKKMEAPQSKKWCFTLNNYSEEDQACVQAWECKYLVYGRETAPETGTRHLQGYVVFLKNARLSAVKKLGPRCHWEVARGSHKQAADYCKKEGDVFEKGELPEERGASEQQRWKRAREAAEAGQLADVPDDIYVRYYRTLKEIKKDHMEKPGDVDEVTGVWFYGKPGSGKSHMAREQYPQAYFKMQNKWWDGYQGEENVILDDLDSKELGHLLKIWSDRYSFLAETKGGALHIRPKVIVVTSNYTPGQLWDDPEMAAAIYRRFKLMKVVDRVAVPSPVGTA